MRKANFTWDWAARDERIASVLTRAVANGIVIDDAAFGVLAAYAGARIGTLLIDARLGGVAVRVQYAFGPAAGRGADVRHLARADGATVDLAALAVRSARRRAARRASFGNHWRRGRFNFGNCDETGDEQARFNFKTKRMTNV